MNETTEKFQQRMDDAKTGCSDFAAGLRGEAQLHWLFSDGENRPGRFDHQGRHEMFDRTEASQNYCDAIEEAAADAAADRVSKRSRQELAMAKFQSDYLSGMERDSHQRHRSRIRMLAHEATSRRHAGSPHGVVQANLLEYLQVQQQRLAAARGATDG